MSNWENVDNLVLRDTTSSAGTNKGSELTYAELDGNQIKLALALLELVSESGIQAWDSSNDYLTGDIVLYGGKLYEANSDNDNKEPGVASEWDEVGFGKTIVVPRKVGYGEKLLFKANGNVSDSEQAGDIKMYMSSSGQLITEKVE